MATLKNIIIVANSGRMLAQFAKKSGFSPLVIDCFADKDTQQAALHFIQVNSLGLSDVQVALQQLAKCYEISHVVYGSGLETQLATLKYLEQNFIILGNSLQSFVAAQHKKSFFLTLARHKIPHPKTVFNKPIDSDGWLLKPLAGEGGVGIKSYTNKLSSDKHCYWQKKVQGVARSVLFVANTTEHEIIGFHEQYTAPVGMQKFVFSGLVSWVFVDEKVEQKIANILALLVVDFSLKGINSLDFIEKNGELSILEINARPSASMNLYSSDLFLTHIYSCLESVSLKKISRLGFCKGYKIIFAENQFTISKQINWPDWVLDIPTQGSIINTAMPICSIIAEANDDQQLKALLLLRQQQITILLR